MPSNIDLSAAEIQLVNEVGREQSLARALHPVLDRYDYVLIDCQPSLGLLTVNGLACADGVIIPTECEYFSLRGLALLTDTVDKVHDRLNPKLNISGILITRYDPRTVNAREVMARVVERFGDLVFDTVITRTVRFPETSVAGEPITTWAPKSGWRRGLSVVGPRGHRPVRRVNDARPRAAQRSRTQTGFQVRLSNFEGPFDLLLQLIFAHRLDVTEVALHQVTDDFIAYTKAIGPTARPRRDHGVPGGRGDPARPQGRAAAARRRGRTTRRTWRCSRCATCCSRGCCSTGRSSTSRRCSPSWRPPRCAAIRGRWRWRTATRTCCPR